MVKSFFIFISIITCLLFSQCNDAALEKKKAPILLADREAPLGWMYLRIYEDSTFEFESRGLERKGDIYSGFVIVKSDTLIFIYKDSIPKAGSIALYNKERVVYINGMYPESLGIKVNKLK